MSKVLITGTAGFIGSQLAAECLARGHEVVGVDAFTTYYDPSIKRRNIAGLVGRKAWTFVEGDLNRLDLAELLDGVETVFHLAAQPGVRASWGETFQAYNDCNVAALQRLLEACRAQPLNSFVFASSSSVYGDAESLPTPEETILRPVSPYGATKALGEHLCHVYFRSYGMPISMLRYFTVYGPRQRPDMAFNRLITAALEGREITLYGDGEQTRDFTFVADAVEGTYAAGRRGHPGTAYNLGGGRRASMNEVLEVIADATGERLRVRREEAQRGDARDTAADTTRAREHLGFRPTRSLEEGIAEQVAWHRAELGIGLSPSAA